MSGERYVLVLDQLGRPLLSNAVAKMHPQAASRARGEWRDTTAWVARATRVPPLGRIRVTAQAWYRTRRSPSDCDAPSPAVKGVIDGLVLAGVIEDDKPPFVESVTYLMPKVGTGEPDALVVTVEAA